MDAPATVLFLVGVDVAFTPYPDLAFTPETTCVTTRQTELDPLDEDFGTTETTTCTTPEGWDGATTGPGVVFPALAVGGALERDRLRLGALVTLGPAFADTTATAERELQADLALGGQLTLEGMVLQGPVSVGLGGLGALRGFGARGEHDDSGATRMWSEAQFGGGPTVSVGLTGPRVYLRAYGVYTTAAAFGGGVTFTWAPLHGAVAR